MVVADEWRARFAEQRWRAERDELWARIGGERELDSRSRAGIANRPVVLVPGGEIEPDGIEVSAPAGARRVGASALAAGWAVRTIESVAAVPRTGILRVVTVRGARHDERFWAAWWNGAFNCAQHFRVGAQVEPLAATDMDTRVKYAYAAAARATRIPLVIGPPKPVTQRGVMDAIEGRRLEST